MDFQFWITVIIAVVYVLSRALKKRDTTPSSPANPGPATSYPQANKPKPLTFEELLKEITEAKETPQRPVYQPRQEAVVDYDDDVAADEAESLETIGKDYRKKDKLYDVYEDAKRQAFHRPSLEETMKVSDTVMTFGKFKEFEQEEQRNLLEEYTRELGNPEGLKKAVVLSEILNRKF